MSGETEQNINGPALGSVYYLKLIKGKNEVNNFVYMIDEDGKKIPRQVDLDVRFIQGLDETVVLLEGYHNPPVLTKDGADVARVYYKFEHKGSLSFDLIEEIPFVLVDKKEDDTFEMEGK